MRNHDELDLGRLTREQRRKVFAEFGPEADMQLYDRGIRRRLAPMLGGDRRSRTKIGDPDKTVALAFILALVAIRGAFTALDRLAGRVKRRPPPPDLSHELGCGRIRSDPPAPDPRQYP